jgi:predicted ArsR family transcriptional regulator
MFDAPEMLPYQPHSPTSIGAAEAMRPGAKVDRAAVLDIISRKFGGLTDEEIQRSLKLNPSTERPRRIELVRAGKVRASGKTRKTASGRPAVVWEAVRNT